MFRSSLVLSLLTAMFAADVSPVSASPHANSGSTPMQTQSTPAEEPSEEKKIVNDARRSLGRELRNL
ncbi:hypothetical protein Pla52o_44540 [Novipirellula galeiformis]|uniref:RxLR effector protein n=1 Tax=Novipirellula galeiformis TaxID=2528004 RepID=A0A5C6CB13_9BACT|nr:hypothetical protein [Novipirellula galeiformis]TWU20576.1 hypothetical protein Pla52o_44540 [Novipirellula galeiformis]